MRPKAVLINPNSMIGSYEGRLGKFVLPVPPQGIAYLGAVLERDGWDVRLVDQYATKEANESLIASIARDRPDMIGLSVLTPAMRNAERLIRGLRAKAPEAKIVLGNTHATVFARELCEQGLADVCVRGEGEATLADLAGRLAAGASLQGCLGITYVDAAGEVREEPDRPLIENLGALPYPAWRLLDIKLYPSAPLIALHEVALPVQASRGCPYQCTFCGQESIYRKVRYRDDESVLDEIEFLHGTFGVKHVGFVDAYYPIDVEQGLAYCEAHMRRGLHKRLRWLTETRVDKVSRELLHAMKRSGCSLIMYGFEVGDQAILDGIRKGFTLDQAEAAMRWTREAGILTLGLFMMGNPGESRETAMKTIRWAKKLDCDIAKFNLAVPLPGSTFYEMVKHRLGEAGLTHPEKFTSWYDWSKEAGDLIFTPEGMSSAELAGLQKRAMLEFYLRPKLILRHLARGSISPAHLVQGGWAVVADFLKSRGLALGAA
ncbi:MAG: B12-binding domain-containing radical SAM protein [Candidatus Methylomirabilis sp.]|nr:B12-binding domain-containing radical SAM protein [Deltaproteobacteria bacterium]